MLFKIIPLAVLLVRQISGKPQAMDSLRQLDNVAWMKPVWSYPNISNKSKESLKQCTNLPNHIFFDDVEETIKRSKNFPIQFPIHSMRLNALKSRRPEEKLKNNIASTYPIIHERVLLLMTNFLNHKREYGTTFEKSLYKDMSIAEFIDRILKNRAVVFMGPGDSYVLLSKEEGHDGWEEVGTLHQKPPLTLDNCLSYDEMKLSSMVYVSGHTECINDGNRYNSGVVDEGNAEKDALIIGIVGPRFERESRMECEDVLITKRQNTEENGYGSDTHNKPITEWRKMWADFYQVNSTTYESVKSSVKSNTPYMDRYVNVEGNTIFDNEVYYKRLRVTAETTLLEAEERGRESGKNVFVNVIGAGLGVWKISSHQTDVFVLTFLDNIQSLMQDNMLNHITDVNFAYIRPSENISALFSNNKNTTNDSEKKLFVKNSNHPKGGINVYLKNREPSSKLSGEHAGKLLAMTYPWDGNAHPGNEFWTGSLSGSGDPAAASSTQVAELHNAHINLRVSGYNTRVAGRQGVKTLAEYCSSLST